MSDDLIHTVTSELVLHHTWLQPAAQSLHIQVRQQLNSKSLEYVAHTTAVHDTLNIEYDQVQTRSITRKYINAAPKTWHCCRPTNQCIDSKSNTVCFDDAVDRDKHLRHRHSTKKLQCYVCNSLWSNQAQLSAHVLHCYGVRDYKRNPIVQLQVETLENEIDDDGNPTDADTDRCDELFTESDESDNLDEERVVNQPPAAPLIRTELLELEHNVRKTFAAMIFDTVVITHQLWCRIASVGLTFANMSQLNYELKQTYTHTAALAMQQHLLQPCRSDAGHQLNAAEQRCYNAACYSDHIRNSTLMLDYIKKCNRAISIKTCRSIYQRHILPYGVFPPALQLQSQVLSTHSSNEISCDNTFKYAKVGRFNSIVPQAIDDSSSSDSDDEYVTPSINSNVTQTASIAATDITTLDTGNQPANADSKLNATSTKRKRVWTVEYSQLEAQLLSVVDSNGFVLALMFVPSGHHEFVVTVLSMLIKQQQRAVLEGKRSGVINIISVDNASQMAVRLLYEYKRIVPNQQLYEISDAPLRLAGKKALERLLKKNNVNYIWHRWSIPQCRNTTGTTMNESVHHKLNGRLSTYGGMRTYITAQQNAIVEQYQTNHRKLHPTATRYQVPIRYLPMNATRMLYLPPIPTDDEMILMLSKIQLQPKRASWTAEQDEALLSSVDSLSCGEHVCHTSDVFYYLTTLNPLLHGKTPKQAKSRFYKLLRHKEQTIRDMQRTDTTTLSTQ